MELVDTYAEQALRALEGEHYSLPWDIQIPDFYGDGSQADQLYKEAYDAKLRVGRRLGTFRDDEDLELIMDNMIRIGWAESKEKFRIGWELAKRKYSEK